MVGRKKSNKDTAPTVRLNCCSPQQVLPTLDEEKQSLFEEEVEIPLEMHRENVKRLDKRHGRSFRLNGKRRTFMQTGRPEQRHKSKSNKKMSYKDRASIRAVPSSARSNPEISQREPARSRSEPALSHEGELFFHKKRETLARMGSVPVAPFQSPSARNMLSTSNNVAPKPKRNDVQYIVPIVEETTEASPKPYLEKRHKVSPKRRREKKREVGGKEGSRSRSLTRISSLLRNSKSSRQKTPNEDENEKVTPVDGTSDKGHEIQAPATAPEAVERTEPQAASHAIVAATTTQEDPGVGLDVPLSLMKINRSLDDTFERLSQERSNRHQNSPKEKHEKPKFVGVDPSSNLKQDTTFEEGFEQTLESSTCHIGAHVAHVEVDQEDETSSGILMRLRKKLDKRHRQLSFNKKTQVNKKGSGEETPVTAGGKVNKESDGETCTMMVADNTSSLLDYDTVFGKTNLRQGTKKPTSVRFEKPDERQDIPTSVGLDDNSIMDDSSGCSMPSYASEKSDSVVSDAFSVASSRASVSSNTFHWWYCAVQDVLETGVCAEDVDIFCRDGA